MTDNSQVREVLLVAVEPGQQEQITQSLRAGREACYTVRAAAGQLAATERLQRGGVDVAVVSLAGEGEAALRILRESFVRLPLVALARPEQAAQLAEAAVEGVPDYLLTDWLNGPVVERVLQYAMERHDLLTDLAITDTITGLYTQVGFTAVAEQYLRLARRLHHSLVLTYLDVDGFGQINAQHGEAEGDWALRQVATLLRTTFRESDLIARLGADDFVFFALGTSDRSPEALTARLNGMLERLAQQQGHPVHIALSAGLMWFDPERSPGLPDLLEQAKADMQARRAARAGGD